MTLHKPMVAMLVTLIVALGGTSQAQVMSPAIYIQSAATVNQSTLAVAQLTITAMQRLRGQPSGNKQATACTNDYVTQCRLDLVACTYGDGGTNCDDTYLLCLCAGACDSCWD